MSLHIFERLGLTSVDIDKIINTLLQLDEALRTLSRCQKEKLLEGYTEFGGYPVDFKSLVALLTKVETYLELLESYYPEFGKFINSIIETLFDVRAAVSSAVFSHIKGINIDYYPAPHLSTISERISINDLDVATYPYNNSVIIGDNFISCDVAGNNDQQRILLSFTAPAKGTRIWMPIFGGNVQRMLINSTSIGFDYWYGYIIPQHYIMNTNDRVEIWVNVKLTPKFEAIKKPSEVWKAYLPPTWIGHIIILRPYVITDISAGAGLLETTSLPIDFGENGSVVPFIKVNGIYFPALGRTFEGHPYPFHYDGAYYYFPIYTSGDFTSSEPLLGYHLGHRLYKARNLPLLSYTVDFSGFNDWAFWDPWKNTISGAPSDNMFAIPNLEESMMMVPPAPTETPEDFIHE